MRNPSTQFETIMLRVVALGVILSIATLALAGCAPVTLDLPPIVNPDWP